MTVYTGWTQPQYQLLFHFFKNGWSLCGTWRNEPVFVRRRPAVESMCTTCLAREVKGIAAATIPASNWAGPSWEENEKLARHHEERLRDGIALALQLERAILAAEREQRGLLIRIYEHVDHDLEEQLRESEENLQALNHRMRHTQYEVNQHEIELQNLRALVAETVLTPE